MGFLPGNQEKNQKYMKHLIMQSLLNCLKEVMLTRYSKDVSRYIYNYIFIIGLTINDAVVIVDECQNMTYHELDSIITRLGENCKIIFCGDFRQSDFRFQDERNGVIEFMKVIKRMKSFDFIEFDKHDIVRSDLVKEYIISKLDLGMS